MSTTPNTVMPKAMLSYVTGLGVEVPDAETVRKDVIEEFRTNLGIGNDWDFTTETILGRLVEAFTMERLGTLGVNAYVAQQTNIFKATGTFLDGLGALFLRNRAAGIVAKVRAKIHISAESITNPASATGPYILKERIPQGIAFGAEDGTVYLLMTDYTSCERVETEDSTATEKKYDYYILALLESTTYGKKDEKGVDVRSTTTNVGGISGVETESVVSYGADDEADEPYRRRLIASRWTGKSFCESLSSELSAIPGVKSFSVVENVTSTPKATPKSLATDKEFLMSPHSVMITVDGGDGDSIARSIFRTKSVGSTMCRCDSGIETTTASPFYRAKTYADRTPQVHEKTVVDSVFGKAHTVIYNTPVVVPISLKLIIGRNNYDKNDDELKAEIKRAVDKWAADEIASVEGVNVGESIYSEEIAAAISLEIPAIKIKGVRLCPTPSIGTDVLDYPWESSAEIMEWEVASINTAGMLLSIE